MIGELLEITSIVPFIVGSEQSSTPLLSPPIQPAGSSSSTGRETIRSLSPFQIFIPTASSTLVRSGSLGRCPSLTFKQSLF